MSRTTRFLKLFLPSDNEYYNVEKDQNENFEKIDKKLGEFDKGKEPTIKDKKTGFNLEKSDRYDYDSSSTLATSRALKLLYDFLLRKIQGIKLTWSAIEEKPSTFPPSTHNHDDRYYTETETDTKLNNLAGKKDGTFPLRHAEKGNVYYLPSTNKYYFCKEDYDGYQISVPNSNFIEMSVYENLNRLNNLDRNFKILYEGNGSYFSSKTLPQDWKMLYVVIAGDGGYSQYTFSYSIPRFLLEKTKCFTFWEQWSNETDWGNLEYDSQTFTISKGQWDNDNQMMIAYI